MSGRRVREAMARAEPVEDAPFDLYGAPSKPKRGGKGRGPDGGGPAPPSSAPPEGGDGGDGHLEACAAEPETDIGNGRRLLIRHRERLLYVANRGMHVFDGRRWAWDETDSLARQLCHRTVERIADERMLLALGPAERQIVEQAEVDAGELKTLKGLKAADLTPEQRARLAALTLGAEQAAAARAGLSGRRSARARHAKSSASSAKLDNMVREAAPYITRTIDTLDAEPLAVNCRSGTLRFFEERGLWDVRQHGHAREDLITKCCEAAYDPEAAAPIFESFFARMQPDEAVAGFVHRYFGYCLLGLTHEQVFAFFHGGGRNGKSTMVDIVCRIMADYATTVPIETLAGDQRRKGGDATPDLMRVPGARLVRASEPESSMRFREAMIKSLTSDEPILIRALHKDFTEVYPSFKLIISGNHKPRIDNDDNGIWRRVLLVPWSVMLDRAEVDKQLGRKLWAERDGIFAWLVRGALSYLQQGLDVPPAVLAATEEYRAESNPIGACLDAYFDFTGETGDTLSPGEIFSVYDRAREGQGWPQFALATFTKRLPEQAQARGAPKHKSMGLSVYLGIRPNAAAESLRARPPRSPPSDDFGGS